MSRWLTYTRFTFTRVRRSLHEHSRSSRPEPGLALGGQRRRTVIELIAYVPSLD